MSSELIFGIVGFVGTAVGLISLGLTIAFNRPKKLFWRKSLRIISLENYDDKLHITYEDKLLRSISFLRIAIWNESARAIMGRDISNSDPLRLSFGAKSDVIRADISSESSQGIGASIDRESHNIKFDVLNSGEAFTVEVIRAGISSDEVAVCGTIGDVHEIKNRNYDRKSDTRWYIISLIIVLGSFAQGAALSRVASGLEYNKISIFWVATSGAILLITIALLRVCTSFFPGEPHIPEVVKKGLYQIRRTEVKEAKPLCTPQLP